MSIGWPRPRRTIGGTSPRHVLPTISIASRHQSSDSTTTSRDRNSATGAASRLLSRLGTHSRSRLSNPDEGLEQPRTLARWTPPRLAHAVSAEHEAAILAARGNHHDEMPGRNGGANRVLELLLSLATTESQLARQR